MMRRTLTFVVTEECNFRCRYCYVEKSAGAMSLDTAKEGLERFLECTELPAADGLVLDFIGGEPLLQADLISSILDYAHRRLAGHPWQRFLAVTTTNGSLYNTLPVQRLLASHRCLEVHITVDGPADVHDAARVYPDGSGTYADVAANIPLWLHQFPSAAMSTKVTLSPNVLPHLARAVLHLFDLGIPQVHANAVFEPVWTPEHAPIFEAQLLALGYEMKARGIPLERCSLFSPFVGMPVHPADDHNWCGVGKWMVALSPDGDFWPCHRLRLPAGNVRDGLDMSAFKPLCDLKRSVLSPPECKTCEVPGGCAWCVGQGYEETGVVSRTTHLCELHKARVRAVRVLRGGG